MSNLIFGNFKYRDRLLQLLNKTLEPLVMGFDPDKYNGFPIIIGIDPDAKKSGIAVVNGITGALIDLHNLNEQECQAFLLVYHYQIAKVVFSAGWLNKKTNFHNKTGRTVGFKEKIAEGVGRNHQVGYSLLACTKAYELKTQELQPNKAKPTIEEFKALTKWKGKSNPETRDAGMLVVGMQAKGCLNYL